jgi:hypothetical protein
VAAQRDIAWVGIDVGKTHHWACVVDAEAKTLLSVKVANDEAEILAFLATAGSLAMQLIWAVTSSVRRRRCYWRCWFGPANRCGSDLIHPRQRTARRPAAEVAYAGIQSPDARKDANGS